MVLLESQVKLKTGDKAPDFELLGIDDKKHNLSEYKQKEGILVIFMCNGSPIERNGYKLLFCLTNAFFV